MLGRGVDQILPHPGDPRLWERYLHDARQYVELAESASGPIPRPVDFGWPWGDTAGLLDDLGPDVRILNLETSITTSDDADPDKGVHYRMHPGNIPCLTAIRPDICTLANNHVLDFGSRGLTETRAVLAAAGIVAVGTGRDRAEATRPATLDLHHGGRLVVFAVGTPSSGVPDSWAATADRPGIWLLPDGEADPIIDEVGRWRRRGDIVLLSIHWGSNWGYDVSRDQTRLAHRLIDAGVDVIFGHSSHHPRPIEIYHGKLVLYGCGDLVDDYEGISGYERYRDDLRLLYIAEIDRGQLIQLRMATMQSHRMRLRHASRDDIEWMRATLDRISQPYGTRIELGADDLIDAGR